MSKFRSKLKRHTKGKSWKRGQSSTSNPENQKHRSKSRSRFFQPNLSTAPPQPGALTTQALSKHEARLNYSVEGNSAPTVNDIASSLKSFNFMDGIESQAGTFETFKTFATDYSACTNASFSKLLHNFRADSRQQKEMLAILTALTEIITERGGSQSSTEYFVALIETIEAAKEDFEYVACISLMSLGIKSVPPAVLRKRFGSTADLLVKLIEKFVDTENQNIIKNIILCLSVVLRAQEFVAWEASSTIRYLDTILAFTMHTKPKIRKAAQHAIVAILCGSCFMIPSEESPEPVKYHPGAGHVAKFCIKQFRPDNLAHFQNLILHTLVMLKEVIQSFKSDDIKLLSEGLLSIMTASNIIIRANCFHTFHSLFIAKTNNLTGKLNLQLIMALYDYCPDMQDIRQTLGWLTVVKQGYISLATKELPLCAKLLPQFIEVCTQKLWMSDRLEIVSGVSNAIKEILEDCIKPMVQEESETDYSACIQSTIEFIGKGLTIPFGHVTTQVLVTMGFLFEAVGVQYRIEVKQIIRTLGQKYDTSNANRVQIEHAILAAISAQGPECVLEACPLADPSTGDIILERTWLLPLLREAKFESSILFYKNHILAIAEKCNQNWKLYKTQNKMALAHTNELLCCQLWGIFPAFCRRPLDLSENFIKVAKMLGDIIENDPMLRAPVLDALKELIDNENEEYQQVVAKYSKNFLPRLFNVYTTKVEGTYENEQKVTILEVIKLFAKITADENLTQMYQMARTKLATEKPGSFLAESLFDIIEILIIFQDCSNIKKFFDEYAKPVLKRRHEQGMVARHLDKLNRQQRKVFHMLEQILESDQSGCVEFTEKHFDALQNLILKSFRTTCNVTQVYRLRCIKIMIEKREVDKVAENPIVKKSIPEVIVALGQLKKKETAAKDLLMSIANLYNAENLLEDFIDIVIVGFGGDSQLILSTIIALETIVKQLGGNLSIKTIPFILDQILVFLVGKNRQEVEASVAFLVTFIKVVPSALLAGFLERIMKSLSAMVPDTKRYCRLQLGYILKKLCKKFNPAEVTGFVPGDDELIHKRLRKIRKELARENRRQAESGQSKADDSDDDDDGMEKKTATIDEILADSDSDDSDDSENGGAKRKPQKKKRDSNVYIQENAEQIMNLMDLNAIGSISTEEPTKSANVTGSKEKTDKNRGFKTAKDGRLIIEEMKNGGGSDSSDSDDDGDTFGAAKGKKRQMEISDSDESGGEENVTKKKMRSSDSMKSGKTGKSGQSSKYVAGGKGIHRSTDAASMKSGVSRKTSASGKSSASTAFGGEYKAKKAVGDMKRKGKVDPYAYVPLNKSSLNQRKRAKNAAQFKNLVRGVKKGGASKIRKRK